MKGWMHSPMRARYPLRTLGLRTAPSGHDHTTEGQTPDGTRHVICVLFSPAPSDDDDDNGVDHLERKFKCAAGHHTLVLLIILSQGRLG